MNNSKLLYTVIWLYVFAYLVLFITWGGIVFLGKQLNDPQQFISYIQNTLAALTGHVLTMLNSWPSTSAIQKNSEPQQVVVAPTVITNG